MNIITKQEKETRIKTIKSYFADDGTEFKTEKECTKYETDIKLKYLAEKYKLKECRSIPYFIFSGFTTCSYTLCIPKENNKKELSALLDILISNVIDVDKAGNFKVDFERDLRNVRKSDTSIEKISNMKLEESKVYVFYVHHIEYCDSYDDFGWGLVSEEHARKELQKEVSEFEELYSTKY